MTLPSVCILLPASPLATLTPWIRGRSPLYVMIACVRPAYQVAKLMTAVIFRQYAAQGLVSKDNVTTLPRVTAEHGAVRATRCRDLRGYEAGIA